MDVDAPYLIVGVDTAIKEVLVEQAKDALEKLKAKGVATDDVVFVVLHEEDDLMASVLKFKRLYVFESEYIEREATKRAPHAKVILHQPEAGESLSKLLVAASHSWRCVSFYIGRYFCADIQTSC